MWCPYVLTMAIINTVTNSEWYKGNSGEEIVSVTTSQSLDKKIYHLLNDVTISARGGTTQIDHILVSRFGVFVIETKHMQGWIYGSPYRKQWTQVIYKNKIQIPNPIHQNYGHVKSLQSLLNLSDDQLFSVIVFTGESVIKTEMPECVVNTEGYIQFVKTKTKEFFSETEVNSLINKIESHRYKKSRMNNAMHVANVKRNKE